MLGLEVGMNAWGGDYSRPLQWLLPTSSFLFWSNLKCGFHNYAFIGFLVRDMINLMSSVLFSLLSLFGDQQDVKVTIKAFETGSRGKQAQTCFFTLLGFLCPFFLELRLRTQNY